MFGTGTTFVGTLKAPIEKAHIAADALRAAGFETEVRENVMEVIWHKVFVNVANNAITALMDWNNLNTSTNPYAHEAARLMVEEALNVAEASGCRFDREAEMSHAFEVIEATADNISSMLQDIPKHRETEIRIINGAVCRIGAEAGVPTPYNELMTQLVLAKQSIYLGR